MAERAPEKREVTGSTPVPTTTPSPRNRDAVRRSFAGQAAAFEDPDRHFGRDDVTAWLAANTPVGRGDRVVDVAAGTAIFGRAVARVAAFVVAVDLTAEMLAAGRRAAASNVFFQQADAMALPFVDNSFDVAVSRLAIHHFGDPTLALREMARVAPTIAVVDMVVPEPELQDAFDELEVLRDPAHTRTLTRQQLRAAVESTGASITHTATRENVIDGERWLDQTNTPAPHAERVRAAWRAELDGGPLTGMAPRRVGGRIEFVHRWDLVVAEVR